MFDPALEGLLSAVREGVSAGQPMPSAEDRPALLAWIADSRTAFDATWNISEGDPDVSVNDIGFGLRGEKLTPSNAAPGKAILYVHGGGQVFGSARSHRGMVSRLAKAAGVTAYNLDYPLAPEHPFPAAMDYTVGAYEALLESGLAGSDIVIGGDSGGGLLAATTLLAIREKQLPRPAGCYMISPMLDSTGDSDTYAIMAKRDPWVYKEIALMCAAVIANGLPLDNPYLSPAKAVLHDMPPIFIQVGSEETLLGDSLAYTRAIAIAGGSVKLDIWGGLFHAWHLFHATLEVAATKAIEEGGAWIASQLK